MTVRIGEMEFDHAAYDRGADVLYLRRGPQKEASDFDASPEGHYLRYDEAGKLFGITVVNARWLLEQDGKIVITLPDGRRVEASDLDSVLAAA